MPHMKYDYTVRQYPGLKGHPKSTPDVPIDYLPTGGSDGMKPLTPSKKSLEKHPTRQEHTRKTIGGK